MAGPWCRLSSYHIDPSSIRTGLFRGKRPLGKANATSAQANDEDQLASNVIFEENFNAETLNENVWGFDLGDGCNVGICGWGNGEKQVYDKASITPGFEGKYLRITAKRTAGDRWASSKILTRDKFTFTYGRVDVRARLPVADGAFPAIWMLPQDNAYGGWPNSGEIDIVEYQSIWRKKFQPEQFRTPGSLHFAKYNGGNAQSFWAEGNDPTQWHTYSMIWREGNIEFLLDDKTYGSYTPPTTTTSYEWPYNKPFFLVINLAIGPGFGSQAPADVNQMTMDVDWIRVSKL
ncbi:concanavalin A-like lectin/glucanase domain-containing protein [Syncephalis plumigaleata]|nr:concanavalin A-like lectin/glucanase domain-containing protein [Syncephalis plumigaleata]